MKVVKEDEEGFMCPAWRRRGTEGEEFGYSSSKDLALCTLKNDAAGKQVWRRLLITNEPSPLYSALQHS